MLSRILVATDFSPRSDRALLRGVVLARETATKLLLTHVVDDDQPDRLIDVERREAAALLDELASAVKNRDEIDVATQVTLGDAFHGIVTMAEKSGVDLVILGPHRRQILRDIFVGTTAERVLRTCRTPVLLANGVPAGPYRKVLIATDFSDSSYVAAEAAKQLGLLSGVEILVVHIMEPFDGGPITRATMSISEARDKEVELIERLTLEATQFARKLDIIAASRAIKLDASSTAKAINKYAKEMKADVIVVGTRAREGVEKWLLGSVAEGVLGSADVDVLAVSSP
jgi:nucleotide-binding universal stress UspA family protein